MKARGRSSFGERNGRAKLTEDRVRELRARVSGGERINRAAAALGIPKGTAFAVATGTTWKHIE